MENLFVLPTDKPSRLIRNEKGIILSNDTISKYLHLIQAKYCNIYITFDEEIKEGDWFIHNGTIDGDLRTKFTVQKWYNNHSEKMYYLKDCKKIILTTDQDLINDGVQAIDDEFLEWFVKNPSCEFVDIKPFRNPNGKIVCYKITIPQEEPKQYKVIIVGDGLPKQETLEEFAKQEAIKFYENGGSFTDLIILGAKWQQEQDKNKFSEEEVLTHLNNLIKMPSSELDKFTNDTGLVTMKWFEQFKKK